jgi:hypothetical protein
LKTAADQNLVICLDRERADRVVRRRVKSIRQPGRRFQAGDTVADLSANVLETAAN